MSQTPGARGVGAHQQHGTEVPSVSSPASWTSPPQLSHTGAPFPACRGFLMCVGALQGSALGLLPWLPTFEMTSLPFLGSKPPHTDVSSSRVSSPAGPGLPPPHLMPLGPQVSGPEFSYALQVSQTAELGKTPSIYRPLPVGHIPSFFQLLESKTWNSSLASLFFSDFLKLAKSSNCEISLSQIS